MKTRLASGILTSLAGRYAKALFELSQDLGQVESVGSSLQSIEKLVQSSTVLKQVLANPTIPTAQQVAALVDICVCMKTPKILHSFLAVLVKAQRIPYLSRIEKIYQSLVYQEKGEQVVEVISAYPLTSSQAILLEDKLKKVFPRTLNLTFGNDSTILGGIKVRVGSRIIDATLITQLNQLATVMKGNT